MLTYKLFKLQNSFNEKLTVPVRVKIAQNN